jgi:N-acetylglucosamine-6-phosphate deacetylase
VESDAAKCSFLHTKLVKSLPCRIFYGKTNALPMKRLIRDAHLISPGIDLPHAHVLIEGGRIVSVSTGNQIPAADEVIEAEGRRLLPGFIDLHSHGADGRSVCDDSVESLRHIARKKLQEGVTTWLPTTLTESAEKLGSIFQKVREYAVSTEIFPRCPGVHLEGPYIHPAKAGAQNATHIRLPDIAELKRLHEQMKICIVSLAPELAGGLAFIAEAKSLGIIPSAAHTTAGYGEIMAACEAGLRHLTHYGNAMSPLHHREIGAVGAGLIDSRLRLEIIPDGIHLAPEMLRLIFQFVPIERLLMITDSTAASWMGNGETTLAGLPVTVKDHIATLTGTGTLAGSALRYHEGLKHLHEITGLPLAVLSQITALNPARALGFTDLGKIEVGYLADLVLLEEDFSVWQTLVAGEVG